MLDPIGVLVVDGQEVFRRGLDAVIAAEPGMEVVGEAARVAEAGWMAAELKPDVVLVDARVPGGGGVAAAAAVAAEVPVARILMMAATQEEVDFYGAARAGAHGYLLKDANGSEVVEAVRSVAGGETPVSPAMASKLMSEFSDLTRKVRVGDGLRAQPLSDRELEVLRLLARGMTNRQVATELFISEYTVKNHVRKILDKLRLRSRMMAVMYAMQEGLIEPDERV